MLVCMREAAFEVVKWWFRVFQWTHFTVIHCFLSTCLRTDLVDSMELERGVTTTAMAKELPRLKLLASFSQST